MVAFKNLVVFTDFFPSGAESERTFMLPELEAAARVFERVVVVPTARKGDVRADGFPENVEVDFSLANYRWMKHGWLRAMNCLNSFTWIASGGSFSRGDLTFASSAVICARFLRKWFKRSGLNACDTVFHTFWFDIAAAGIALSGLAGRVKWVSSAHGFDIFTRRCLALRRRMLAEVSKVYCASLSGAEFMRGKFRGFSEKIDVRTLGCYGGERSVLHSLEEKRVTVVSVSRVDGNKRVDLVAQMLSALSVARPHSRFHWIHVGDGPLMHSLRVELEGRTLPPNFSYDLRGSLPNDKVREIYACEPVDWFIMLSRYEGGNAIALCEAMAHGIPAIVTDTTGLGEAVNDDCAVIMPLDVTAEEFVRGMVPYLESDSRHKRMSESAFIQWKEKYNASALRSEFYKSISNVS